MPFITLSSGLTIKVPTVNTTNWAATMLSDTFQKISEHDHTGSGRGTQIGAAALAADAVTSAKILLDNDSYLRSRNNADTADINVVKVDTSNNIIISNDSDITIVPGVSTTIAKATTITSGNLTLSSGDVSASGAGSFGGNVSTSSGNISTSSGTMSCTGNISTTGGDIVADDFKANQSFTFTDGGSNETITGLLLDDESGAKVHYNIIRQGTADLRETGILECVYDGSAWQFSREYMGDDSLVTFSFSGNQLQMSNTSNPGSSSEKLYWSVTRLGE